ncbi:hypothetical protein HOU95_gp093 [Streptomyces phage Hiyaa]|uniref:Uncharacterized protein n=1 Tax=Streptomyces phage Hiyaa TaxID=2499072 RepID=A0A3S9U8R7_9CAUD|nr:hypothetical protein HOU95_gp093 [Streptomyces phage Hiyaa]AZS06714.1 hypothetical protein SEA_HIYAA_75 [Streptomyces phage Hiyaa]
MNVLAAFAISLAGLGFALALLGWHGWKFLAPQGAC